MPLTAASLITTVGGSTSNSYASLVEFATYCDERLNTETFDETAEPDDRIRALLMAGRRLEREIWLGVRASSTQKLSWPRYGVRKVDAVGTYNEYSMTLEWPADEIPQPIKDAQMEMALAYLDGFDDGEEDQIDSFSADGVSVKFRASRPSGALPVAVSQLIASMVQGNRLRRA